MPTWGTWAASRSAGHGTSFSRPCCSPISGRALTWSAIRDAKNVLFEMVFHQAPALYIPFLLLSICATVIASQAMISGMFSLVFQGIMIRIMPILKVDFTSHERQTQIYLGAVNWSLLLAVLFIIFEFQTSTRLAVAYGLAVTGTMAITGVMMIWIFLKRREKVKAVVSGL